MAIRIAAQIKDFPKTIYVWVDTMDKDKVLLVERNLESCADISSKVLVGIYKLEKVGNAVANISFEEV